MGLILVRGSPSLPRWSSVCVCVCVCVCVPSILVGTWVYIILCVVVSILSYKVDKLENLMKVWPWVKGEL